MSKEGIVNQASKLFLDAVLAGSNELAVFFLNQHGKDIPEKIKGRGLWIAALAKNERLIEKLLPHCTEKYKTRALPVADAHRVLIESSMQQPAATEQEVKTALSPVFVAIPVAVQPSAPVVTPSFERTKETFKSEDFFEVYLSYMYGLMADKIEVKANFKPFVRDAAAGNIDKFEEAGLDKDNLNFLLLLSVAHGHQSALNKVNELCKGKKEKLIGLCKIALKFAMRLGRPEAVASIAPLCNFSNDNEEISMLSAARRSENIEIMRTILEQIKKSPHRHGQSTVIYLNFLIEHGNAQDVSGFLDYRNKFNLSEVELCTCVGFARQKNPAMLAVIADHASVHPSEAERFAVESVVKKEEVGDKRRAPAADTNDEPAKKKRRF